MSNIRLGPQNCYIVPVTSITHGEYFNLTDLLNTFTDGQFNTFWQESSDGQYGPFNFTMLPYQFYDDSAAPLDYNSYPGPSNTLITFANQRIAALLGTSTEIKYYTWFYLMLPRFSSGAAGGGGSTYVTMRGYLNLGALLHELGHGLGMMGEGSGQRCNDAGCAYYDYDDTYSIMGDAWGRFPRQFSTTRKQAAGWVNGIGQSKILNITQSGDYNLASFERGAKGRTIALRTSVGVLADLEARIDGDTSGLDKGIIFRNGDTILDLDRSSSGAVKRRLAVGEVFNLNGVSYTPLSFDLTGAVVRITFPGGSLNPVTNLRAA